MKSEFYSFDTNENSLYYAFQSISDKKIIEKVIVYTPLPDNPDVYNLALGDKLPNGEICDLTISNNDDMPKVIATVVQTMIIFFEKHPQSFVYFKGSTPERTRLYRIIISRELNEASKIFQIYGIFDDEIKSFELNCPYESFVISLKKQLL